MKKINMFLFVLIILSFLFFGCVSSQTGQDSNDLNFGENNQIVSGRELSYLKEVCEDLNKEFLDCVNEKKVCEERLLTMNLDNNCPECICENDCPVCPIATDCDAIASSLSEQINNCASEKAILQNNLDNCNNIKTNCETEKEDCLTELDTANTELAKMPDFSIYHYVKGNLFESGDYRQGQAFVWEGTKKVIVGLDYTGGEDDHFASHVSQTYGLNLVKWYELEQTSPSVFEPTILKDSYSLEAGDTVLIELGDDDIYHLKIKSTEFDAATSKEGLAVRRIIVIYMN